MNFEDIIGHERNIEVLRNSINNNTLSHSYLFEGEDSLGKKMVAMAFSKAILCESHGEKPCNICSSCIKFHSFNHPDLFLIEPEKDLIKVEEVEKLIQNTLTAPFQSEKKIFLIDESDKMNLTAQNKILKTLEETPAYVNIILISSNSNKLLPTILSRVQRLKFYPVEGDEIVSFLEDKYNTEDSKARFVVNFTKGAVGRSISLIRDDKFFLNRDIIIKLIDDLVKGDMTKVFNSAHFFNENKDKIEEILDVFLYWFRDLAIYKEIGDSDLLINRDKLESLSSQSFMDTKKINDIMEKIRETKINIDKNINYQLSIETMLFNIQGEL